MSELRIRPKYVRVRHASGRGVAARWMKQYRPDGVWGKVCSGNSKEIYEALIALGENPSIESVASVIGNQSWSYICCESCLDYVSRAVELGANDAARAYCETCLLEAVSVIQQDTGAERQATSAHLSTHVGLLRGSYEDEAAL